MDAGTDQQRQSQILESVLNRHVQEKREVAQYLHSQVGALLSVAKLKAALLARNPAGTEQNLPSEASTELLSLLTDAIRGIRHATQLLLPAVAEEQGLAEACRALAASLGSGTGIQCRFREEIPQITALEKNCEISLFCVLRELAGHRVKQAGPDFVQLNLIEDKGCLRISYHDNGRTDPAMLQQEERFFRKLAAPVLAWRGAFEFNITSNSAAAIIKLALPQLAGQPVNAIPAW